MRHKMKVLYAAVILLASTLLVWTQDYDGHADWIDPHDMINFDASKLSKNYKSANVKDKEVEPEYIVPMKGETLLNSASRECPKCPDVEKEDNSKAPEMPYFRQFIRGFLNHFPFTKKISNTAMFDVKVKFSSDDITVLNKFASSESDGNVQDAHSVMVNIVQDVTRSDLEYFPVSIDDYLPLPFIDIVKVLGIVVCAVAILYISIHLYIPWKQLIVKMFITLFLISVPWNWLHLYKKAVAKQQAAIMTAEIPESCRPAEELSWRNALSQWFQATFTFTQDSCTKYQEILLVDPLLEVAPTQALAVTITKFFVAPLEHVGHAISQFFRGLLVELPIQLWFVVLPIVIIFILIILLMIGGYNFHFFHLIGIQRDHTIEQNLRNEIHYLKDRLENNQRVLRTQAVVGDKHNAITYNTSQNNQMDVIQLSPSDSSEISKHFDDKERSDSLPLQASAKISVSRQYPMGGSSEKVDDYLVNRSTVEEQAPVKNTDHFVTDNDNERPVSPASVNNKMSDSKGCPINSINDVDDTSAVNVYTLVDDQVQDKNADNLVTDIKEKFAGERPVSLPNITDVKAKISDSKDCPMDGSETCANAIVEDITPDTDSDSFVILKDTDSEETDRTDKPEPINSAGCEMTEE